jgi:phosphatidylglycerophosphate synthase
MNIIPRPTKLYLKISKNILQESSIETDELWYSRLFGRKISIYFTWYFLRLGLTPNKATLISFLVGLLGLLLFSFDNILSVILGFVFFHLYIIIDSSDGEMARYLNMKSELGAFYDKLLHYVMKIGILLVLTLHAYYFYDKVSIIIFGLGVALISGLASSFYHLLPRNNNTSYSEQVGQDGFFLSIARKLFRSITGDIELSIIIFLTLMLGMIFNQIKIILFPLLVFQLILMLLYFFQQFHTILSKK